MIARGSPVTSRLLATVGAVLLLAAAWVHDGLRVIAAIAVGLPLLAAITVVAPVLCGCLVAGFDPAGSRARRILGAITAALVFAALAAWFTKREAAAMIAAGERGAGELYVGLFGALLFMAPLLAVGVWHLSRRSLR